jgi:hypothetical protein
MANMIIAPKAPRGLPSYTISNGEPVAKYLPEFIDLLKENFIDCDIIVDPLKTYLIIDWS